MSDELLSREEAQDRSREVWDTIHAIDLIPDPRFEQLRSFESNIMQVYPIHDPRPYKRRNFFWRCWDAWRPAARRNREAKLMRQETPVANLLWSVWHWIRYSKAHRAKPWKVEMHNDPDHAMMVEKDWPPRTPVDFGLPYRYYIRPEFPASLILSRPPLPPPITREAFDRWMEENADLIREMNGTKPRRCTIALDGLTIQCLTCGHVSEEREDIRSYYCPLCRRYQDMEMPGRQREIVELIEARNFEAVRSRPAAAVITSMPIGGPSFRTWITTVQRKDPLTGEIYTTQTFG